MLFLSPNETSMFIFAVALVFGAHPDFWLTDESLIAKHDGLKLLKSTIDDDYKSLGFYYQQLNESRGTSEEELCRDCIKSWTLRLNMYEQQFRDGIAAKRLVALAAPKRYPTSPHLLRHRPEPR